MSLSHRPPGITLQLQRGLMELDKGADVMWIRLKPGESESYLSGRATLHKLARYILENVPAPRPRKSRDVR